MTNKNGMMKIFVNYCKMLQPAHFIVDTFNIKELNVKYSMKVAQNCCVQLMVTVLWLRQALQKLILEVSQLLALFIVYAMCQS